MLETASFAPAIILNIIGVLLRTENLVRRMQRNQGAIKTSWHNRTPRQELGQQMKQLVNICHISEGLSGQINLTRN